MDGIQWLHIAMALAAGGAVGFRLGCGFARKSLDEQERREKAEGIELVLIRDARDDGELALFDTIQGTHALTRKRGMQPEEVEALRSPEARERHRRAAEALAILNALREEEAAARPRSAH
jgi:hypothetical protein